MRCCLRFAVCCLWFAVCWLLVVGRRRLFVGCSSLVAEYCLLLFVMRFALFAVCCLLCVVVCRSALLVVGCLLIVSVSVGRCLVFVVC